MNDPFINPNWKPKFEKRLLYVVIFATSLGLPGSETKTSSMTQEVNSSVMWSCPPVFGQARDPNEVRWKVMGAPTCMTVSSVHSIFQSCNCRYCHGTKTVSNADLKSHKKGPWECNRGGKQHPCLLPFSPPPPGSSHNVLPTSKLLMMKFILLLGCLQRKTAKDWER